MLLQQNWQAAKGRGQMSFETRVEPLKIDFQPLSLSLGNWGGEKGDKSCQALAKKYLLHYEEFPLMLSQNATTW